MKILKREVNEAAAEYQKAMQRYGPNNMVTQRAEIKYYELKRAYDNK